MAGRLAACRTGAKGRVLARTWLERLRWGASAAAAGPANVGAALVGVASPQQTPEVRRPGRDLWRRCWRALRRLSGDDAYERYVAHRRAAHAADRPLSRAEFYHAEIARKWDGVRRCC